jgi:gliding motility-associated lipoprotein GldH
MLLFVACSDEYVFQDHKVIPNEKWKADNDLTFVLTISDTTTSYRLGFTIRYNDKYAYQNLYMFLKTTLPNGKQVIDTVSCDLFEQDGNPLGKGNRIKERSVIYGTLNFPMVGKYTMKVIHAMRKDTLDGINSIGMFLSEVKVNK